MRLIDADVLKQHIDKLPALPDGNFAGNHSALKALINMQPTIESSTNCSEFPNNSDTISRQAAMDALNNELRCGAVINQCGLEAAYEVIEDLPSAQPKRGWWIEIINSRGVVVALRCSRCEKSPRHGVRSDFCPNCGAEMEDSEDEND